MQREITIYHSPDADDAFMFYGFAKGAVGHPGYRFSHQLLDIESLNHLALKSEIEVTAVSVHALGYLADKYRVLSCGASMGGKNYGPKLVAPSQIDLHKAGANWRVGVPGNLTSAALAFKLFQKEKGLSLDIKNFHFEEIIPAIKNSELDAGIIIHEGQITHPRDGLAQLLDLGEWWWNLTALPLPLGVNVVRKDLGLETAKAVKSALQESVEFALKNRKEALEYALSYGRGITLDEADRFVAMYVNELTLDLGEAGRAAICSFLEKAQSANFLQQYPSSDLSELEFV